MFLQVRIKRIDFFSKSKTEPEKSREMSEEWNDVEINHLTDALESMRKKGHTLGLYGLNDQQATWIHKQHLPTKSIRQIKRLNLF